MLLTGAIFILQSDYLKLQSPIQGYSQDAFQKLSPTAWSALDDTEQTSPNILNLGAQLVNLAKTYSQKNPDTVRPSSVDIK